MRQITKNHYGKGYPMKWWGLSVLGILLLGFTTACEDQENDPRDPVTQQDMDFAVDATYSNLSEIEFGQLAVEKAEYESVRDFGVLMVTDHTNAQNQLATIAGIQDIEVPDTLKAEHQLLYDQLLAMEGEAFDSAYIRSQIEAHQQAQQIFQTQIEEGSYKQLLDFASSTLPHINAHLERAMELKDELMPEDE